MNIDCRVDMELQSIDARTSINLPAFRKFTKTHQALLFPAFQLQNQLQRKVLGVAFWHRASNRRVEMCNGNYVTMSTLMQLVRHSQLLRTFHFCQNVNMLGMLLLFPYTSTAALSQWNVRPSCERFQLSAYVLQRPPDHENNRYEPRSSASREQTRSKPRRKQVRKTLFASCCH